MCKLSYKLHSINAKDKVLLDNGSLLPLMEEFYTIQGEGFNTGKAAYFIRIGGCDVGCHWCDVKESWDANLHPLTSINQIITNILTYKATSVVVTGGEPLIYNLELLCKKLKENSIKTPLSEIYLKANELKVIIFNLHDFIWAEEQSKKVNSNCYFYLQPEWSKQKELIPLIIEYVKKNPKWMISLQTHKYMNIP